MQIHSQKNAVLVEAESFSNAGGWVTDQQFMDHMGSPFLMAHGLGIPVKDASTTVEFPRAGRYHMFVRTRNWVAPWTKGEAPGRFMVVIDGNAVEREFGTGGAEWSWQDGGMVTVRKESHLALRDLTGFNGRCDAIFFTPDETYAPPTDKEKLTLLRERLKPASGKPADAGTFDFVVIGGGMAGTCAAISAARLGLKVALVQDRPVLGGNNSTEVRVHLGGRINLEPWPALGNLVNEIGPSR